MSNSYSIGRKENGYAVGISEVITEKKQLEVELAETHKKLMDQERRTFIEAVNTLSDPFVILDKNYCFKYMTPTYAAFYGKTPEELLNRSYWEAFPELVGSVFYRNCCKVMTERKPVHFEWKAIFSDAWFEDRFHPLKDGGLVIYCRDITERKQAEINLRQSEEKFQKIFHNSPDMMIIFQAENFHILEVNQRFLDVLGLKRDEIIGRSLADLNLIPDWDNICKQSLGKDAPFNCELEMVTRTGEKISVITSTNYINIGGVECLLSVIKNITNEKKLENKIVRLQQLHLIGEMAAGIGHEVRNPMTTVKGYLQLFREKPEFEKYQDRLNLMIDELDRANGIITEFLALSRNKTSFQQKQQLNDIITTIVPLLEADALKYDKYISLKLGHLPHLMLDEKEIRQVIHNLVRNGLEASPPGGYVTIKTYRDEKEAVLEVSDQGRGMEPEVLEKAGTPFFTTKNMGTGMGLPICFSIAERHKASIEIQSGATGTTVAVRFKIT